MWIEGLLMIRALSYLMFVMWRAYYVSLFVLGKHYIEMQLRTRDDQMVIVY